MAFGLSPKHVQELPLADLTTEQFLVIAIESAKYLGWNIGHTSETRFTAFTQFSGSYSEEVKVNIENGVVYLKSECTGNQIVDWGKNKKNVELLIETIAELKNSFTPDQLHNMYEELKTNIAQENFLGEPPTTKEKLGGFFSIFKPTQGYYITPILIDLNIFVFLLMVFSGVNFLLPDNESLIKWGANFRPVTLEGDWWRLITNCFLHIGFIHLLMNMYALLYIGLLLEPHLGKIRFLSAYLLTGLIASITSLWWHDLTISAGASGAIFGMYGVFLALLTTNLIEKSARKALFSSIGIFVAYNLVNGLKGGIDNAAHIGGLIGGLVIGYALIPSLKSRSEDKLKYSSIGLLVLIIVTSSFAVYKRIPNNIGLYDKKMKEFALMESKALEVYNLPQNTSNEKLLHGLKENGIYYWQEDIKLLNSFNKLKLPAQITNRNRILREYCELRIKSYGLLYKAISENTKQYQEQVEEYNKQIEAKINELRGGNDNK